MTSDFKLEQEVETFDVTAPLVPSEFVVVCPSCMHNHEASAEEDFDGLNFSPRSEDKFIKCDCGALIEILPIAIRPEHKTPWVIIDSIKQVMHCQRCDEKEPLSLINGKRISFATGIMRAFTDCHTDCREKT